MGALGMGTNGDNDDDNMDATVMMVTGDTLQQVMR
jgi:hypothetical protein